MLIAIIGGAASGKSALAENLAMKLGGRKAYIAAMEPSCPEALSRIERHRNLRRGKDFCLMEKYRNLHTLSLKEFDTVLLECVSNLTANEMFGGGGPRNVYKGLEHLLSETNNLVVVTNDIFCDVFNQSDLIKNYMKTLGEINRFLASRADIFLESAAGIALCLKGRELYEKLF